MALKDAEPLQKDKNNWGNDKKSEKWTKIMKITCNINRPALLILMLRCTTFLMNFFIFTLKTIIRTIHF